jgi:3-oxoacyl-[acyl-carrier protein] reductase
MDLGIRGRTAIVGASSRGLGRACAEALAAEGVDVVINGRDEDHLRVAAKEIAEAHDVKVRPVRGDLVEASTRTALLEACPAPDIVVTNCGGPPPGRLQEVDRNAWISALEHNMLAHIELVNAVIDGMCERRFGRIVNITSAMVTTPRPTMALSAGVRAGLTAALKGLALDVAVHNVTINNLLPERFDTQRQLDMANETMKRHGLSWQQARAQQAESIAAKRLGHPRELGAACAFLCSSLAGYISGQNLHLDGGSYPGLL